MAGQSDERPQATEEELSQVKELLKSTVKTFKTLAVYPRENPVSQKFIRDLSEKFTAFLEKFGELPLEVEQFALLYKGQEVFYSEERTDNIALNLFVDGIRQLSFKQGLSTEELVEFLYILLQAPKEENPEDDIVTLLWERELEHISYFVPEEVHEADTAVEEELLAMVSTQEGGSTVHGATYSELTIKPAGPLGVDVLPLSDDELQALKKEASAETGPQVFKRLLQVLLVLMADEEDMGEFGHFCRALGRLMDLWVERNDTVEFLRLLKGVSSLAVGAPQGKTERLEKLLQKASGRERMEWFMGNAQEQEAVAEYLEIVGPYAVGTMIEVLGELQDRRQRRLVCNVLASLATEHLEAFVKHLQDERWYLVRNLVMILGMSKEPKAVKAIVRVLRHPEVKVRREVVKALELMGTPEVLRPLRELLRDADTSVRTAAARALKRFRASELKEDLEELIGGSDFRKRPFPEKREFLELYGVVAGKDGLPLLERLLKRKGLLFHRDEYLELRAAAAYGLGWVGGKEAQALLESELDSKKSLLREAVRTALAEVRRK